MEDGLKDAARSVFNELGGGFSENIYHRSMEHELSLRGIGFSSEAVVPIQYKGVPVGYRRPDFLITGDDGEKIVVELKANSGGEEQLREYLSLTSTDDNLGYITRGYVIDFADELRINKIDIEDG